MTFPETTERFIAYFDIMGFKDLIYRNDHAVVSTLMNNVSKTISEIKEAESSTLKKIGAVEGMVSIKPWFFRFYFLIPRYSYLDLIRFGTLIRLSLPPLILWQNCLKIRFQLKEPYHAEPSRQISTNQYFLEDPLWTHIY